MLNNLVERYHKNHQVSHLASLPPAVLVTWWQQEPKSLQSSEGVFYKHLSLFRSSQSWCSDSPPAAGRLWCLQARLRLSTQSQKAERAISKRMSLGFQLLLRASRCWECLAVLVMGSWKQISSQIILKTPTLCYLHSPSAPPSTAVMQHRVNTVCLG